MANNNIHAQTEAYLQASGQAFQLLQQLVAGLPDAAVNGNLRAACTAHMDQLQQDAVALGQAHGLARVRVQQGGQSPPMTRVFTGEIGANAVLEVPPPRQYRLDNFEGDYKEPEKCLDWLARAMIVARELRLAPACLGNFMQRHCIGPAGTCVREALERGQDIHGIVRALEVQFAGLQDPISATRDCQNIVRREGETIAQFCARIKYLANMATRQRPNPIEAAGTLAMDTFMMSVGIYMRQYIQQKGDLRLATGQAPLEWGEVIQLASQHETERNATLRHQRQQRQQTPRSGSGAFWVEEATPGTEGEVIVQQPTAECEEEREDEQEGVHLIRDPNRGARGPTRGRGTPRGGYRGGLQGQGPFRALIWRAGPPAPQGQQPQVQWAQPAPAPQGVPNEPSWVTNEGGTERANHVEEVPEDEIFYIPDAQGNVHRMDIKTLGVQPGECCKCGLKGHRAFGPTSQSCPLRAQPLTTRCPKCQKGGHHPTVCPNRCEVPKN